MRTPPLSSIDMHPFVHAFNPAIARPWQTCSDFDAFHALAGAFSPLLGKRRDLAAVRFSTTRASWGRGRRVRNGPAGEDEGDYRLLAVGAGGRRLEHRAAAS
jgi:nitrate reductase / nitrite oxidoreductase, alpha subunit